MTISPFIRVMLFACVIGRALVSSQQIQDNQDSSMTFDELKREFDILRNAQQRYEQKLMDHDTKLENHDTKLENYDTKLENYDTKLENYDTKLENHDTKLQNYDTKLENYDTKLEDYDTKLDNHDTKLENYDTKLENYDTKLENQDTKLDNYDTKLEKYDTKLENHDTKLENQDTKLENYDTKLENQDNQLYIIHTQVEENVDGMYNLANQMENATTTQASEGGSVYTRWGRTICGINANFVYAGVMGRAGMGHTGGADYQCLPEDPLYVDYVDGFQHDGEGRGIMYGVEYMSGDAIYDMDNLGDSTFTYNDVPCAVCHIANRTSVLMIPARDRCPIGWTEQYWGYLVTENYNGAASSTHECVDHAPEAVPGGSTDENSGAIYNVEGHCFSLPCPNYIDGWELTCVVCSK